MALAAGFEIVRRPLHNSRVGKIYCLSLLVAFMTGFASLGEMRIAV